jgi:acyl carrier protein
MDDIQDLPRLFTAEEIDASKEERIAGWLRQYIGGILGMPPTDISEERSFQQLGLDSSAAVGMTGDLSDWLGREIDAAAAYDHTTIRALARALAGQGRAT